MLTPSRLRSGTASFPLSGTEAEPTAQRHRRSRRRPSRRRRRTIRRYVLLVGGLLAAGLLFQLFAARAQLLRARSELNATKKALANVHTDDARESLARADAGLRAAHRAVGFPVSLVKPIPLVGSPARAVDDGVRAGHHVVAAGRVLTKAAATFPTSGAAGLDGHDLSSVHRAAVDSGPPLIAAWNELAVADRALAGARGASLPFVSSSAKSVDDIVRASADDVAHASRALGVLARLSAPDADKRLLLLSQDTLEARPSGGFVGSLGVLHFIHGTVALEDFKSYEDLPRPNPPLDAPDDLVDALDGTPWDISNVGWWPNFPTVAPVARDLYQRQGGPSVDGVIAMTQHVLRPLLGVIGPVQVPGYVRPVSEDGLEDRILYEVEEKRPLDVPRKKFLTLLSHEVMDRLFRLRPGQLNPVATIAGRAASAGDLQAWFADGDDQGAVTGTSWAGELPEPTGDFLMLTDSNMYASKANRFVTRDLTYRVTRDGKGRLIAHLRGRYRNTGSPSSANPGYLAYLRAYVPAGSRLIRASGGGDDVGAADDGPFETFATWVNVDPGAEGSFDMEYVLPRQVASDGRYTLEWFRQVGMSDDHLTASVDGHVATGDPTSRHVTLAVDLDGHGVRGFLHKRWLFRRMGL